MVNMRLALVSFELGNSVSSRVRMGAERSERVFRADYLFDPRCSAQFGDCSFLHYFEEVVVALV